MGSVLGGHALGIFLGVCALPVSVLGWGGTSMEAKRVWGSDVTPQTHPLSKK